MTGAVPDPSGPVAFTGVTPIFRVGNLAASVAHYVDVLGFALDWREGDVFAAMSRGPCHLFLCTGDQGHPGGWVWMGVADADALHDEYVARGATIRQPPTNFAWALELQVEDPDGNVLRLGSEPKPDVPYGPWLDMRGDRWMPAPGGGWMPVSTADDATTATTPASDVSPDDGPVAPLDDAATRAHTLRDMAERARRTGDRDSARLLYEEAVALLRTLDDPLTLAHAVRHLGDVLHEARQPALAEPHHVEAVALYRAHPAAPPLDLANAVRSLAISRHDLGDLDASRRLWDEASRLYATAQIGEGVAESAAWSARLAWRAGELARAREWLAVARAASDASQDPETWKFVRTVGLELGG